MLLFIKIKQNFSFTDFMVITMLPAPIFRHITNIPKGVKINPTKFFNRVFDEGELAHNILNEQPPQKQFIGTIPRVFFSSLSAQEIPNAAIKIRELFAQFSNLLSMPTDDTKIIKLFKKELKKLIKQNIKVENLGIGTRANTFKLTVKDKNFTVKTFKSATQVKKSLFPGSTEGEELFNMAERSNGHGGEIEPILAKFIAHKTGTGVVPRFYFGKLGHNNSSDGYMVTKYVDEKAIPQIKNIALLHVASPLNFRDLIVDSSLNLNHINGIVYDIGGVTLKNHFPNDLGTAKLIRELCKIIDKDNIERFKIFWKKNLNNPKLFNAFLYINQEARFNNLFKEYIHMNKFTPDQKEILKSIGVKFKSSLW